MGFFGDIFGGIKDSIFGSKPHHIGGGNIETVSTLSKGQQKLLDENLLPFLQGVELEGLRDTPAPLGVTGRTPLAATSLAVLEELAGQAAEGGRVAKTAEIQRDKLLELLDRGPQDVTEFFNTNVRDPAIKDFSEIVLPQLARRFGGNDLFSSERVEADERAREDVIDALVQARTGLEHQAFKDNTQVTFDALDRLASTEALVPTVVGAILDAGETIRAQDAEKQAATRQEDLRQRELQDRRLQQILAALGLPTVENVAFAPTFAQGQQGIAGQAAMAALGSFL